MTFDNVFLITEERVYSLQDVCQSGFLHSLPFCMPVPTCMLLCMSASVGLHCVYLQVASLLYPLICLPAIVRLSAMVLCLPVFLPVFLYACLHVCLPACVPLCLNYCVSACFSSRSSCLLACLFVYAYLVACPSSCLLVYTPAFLSSSLYSCLPACLRACVPGCFLPVCLSQNPYLVTCPHA